MPTSSCQPQPTRTFSPLAGLLPERTTPELVYLEAKFAGLVSYGLSARLPAEVLPLGRTLDASAVRHHAQAVARRLDDELGPEQVCSPTVATTSGGGYPGRTSPWSSASTAASCTPPISAHAGTDGSR